MKYDIIFYFYKSAPNVCFRPEWNFCNSSIYSSTILYQSILHCYICEMGDTFFHQYIYQCLGAYMCHLKCSTMFHSKRWEKWKMFSGYFILYWNENDEWIKNIAVVTPVKKRGLNNLVRAHKSRNQKKSLLGYSKPIFTKEIYWKERKFVSDFSINFLSVFNSNNVTIFLPFFLLFNHQCVKILIQFFSEDNLN